MGLVKPALLLVDLQADYLAARALQPIAEAVVARAAQLLSACRAAQVPVIHIWTTIHREDDRRLPHWRREDRWQCVAGTSGHEPPEQLAPHAGEAIVHKSGFNAFGGSALSEVLRRLDRDAVILAGVHLHTCVRLAAMECLERGFGVRIAEDAVASNDPIHAAATRRWLAARCVEFAPARAITASLAGVVESFVHRSPRRTAEIVFEVPRASAAEIAFETATACDAWKRWRRSAPDLRRTILRTVADRLEAAAPELARQMALEIGKPIAHGFEEVRRGAANVRDVARRAAAFSFEKAESGGAVHHRPLGVVGLISPWNNPVAIPVGKIAPALAYGNTVVWKPAPAAKRIAEAVLKLLREAGVPNDAVRLVIGDHNTAQELASHDGVDAVTLTGSLAAGYAMEEICARRMIPLQAELGGNNAAIVWKDADLAHAAKQVAWGAFGFAGQRCTANRRAIVQAGRFEEFLSELRTAGQQLVWGDPLGEATDIGPVINIAKRDETFELIARVGGEVLHGAVAGERWVKEGAYVQPAIVRCDEPAQAIVQEETMSPILVLQPAKDFEHALALCNGTRYGLAAALFTNDADLQVRFLEEARAGILKINSSTAGADISLPFGGWKASGVGPPEHGDADALFYNRMQAVYRADG